MIGSDVIYVFVVETFHEARMLLQVGCVTPINIAASIQKRNPATWLQLPSSPAVDVKYALKIPPPTFSCWNFFKRETQETL